MSDSEDDSSSESASDRCTHNRFVANPDPFADLIASSPECIASRLEQFHQESNSQRYGLACSIKLALRRSANTLDPSRMCHSLFGTKLPVILVEIASEPSLFDDFTEDRSNTVSLRFTVIYRRIPSSHSSSTSIMPSISLLL